MEVVVATRDFVTKVSKVKGSLVVAQEVDLILENCKFIYKVNIFR